MKPRSRRYIKSKIKKSPIGVMAKWWGIIIHIEMKRIEKLGIKSPFDK